MAPDPAPTADSRAPALQSDPVAETEVARSSAYVRAPAAPAPLVTRPLDPAPYANLTTLIGERFGRPELGARVTLIAIDTVTLETILRASQPFLSLANSDFAEIGDPGQPDFSFHTGPGQTLNLKILRAFEYTDFLQSLNASGTVVSELGDIGDWTLTMNSARDMVSGTIRTDDRIFVFQNTTTPSVRFVVDLDRRQYEGTAPGN